MSREAGRGTGDVVSAAATTGAGVGVATGFGGVAQATDLATAQFVADRMRKAIAEADLSGVLGAGTLGGITVSVGVALFRASDTIASFVERADRSLYEAKRQGRNRVVLDLDRAA